MKSKKAQECIDNDAIMMNNGDRMVDASTAYQAVELAEQEAEERHTKEMQNLKHNTELRAYKCFEDLIVEKRITDTFDLLELQRTFIQKLNER